MKRAPWVLGVVFVLILLNTSLVLLAKTEREAALQNAANFAQLAITQSAEHTDSVFDQVDRTLVGIADVMSREPLGSHPEKLELQHLLVRRHAATPILRALFVISPEGMVLNISSRTHVPELDVADRDYVRYHLSGGSNSLFIGKPNQNRLTGKWIVPVSRRVEDGQGRIVAIIAAAFDPEVFVATLKNVSLPNGMRAAMIAPSGDILGCLPQADCLGSSATDWPVFMNSVHPGAAETVHEGSFVPGSPGPAGFEVSRGYGITVAMTVDKYQVLASWQNRMPIYLALGLGGSTGIVSVMFALYQQMKRRNEAMADLARANVTLELRVTKRTAELQKSEERLRAFLATARDPMIIIDGRGIVLSFNQAAVDLFGYDAEDVLGMSVNMLMPNRIGVDHNLHGHSRPFGVAPAGTNREIIALHRDGTEIPVEITVGSTERTGEHIHVAVVRDIRARKAHDEALWRLANIDGLTDALNRRAFLEQGALIVDTARRYKQPLAALMVDADHFKRINDTYGHHVGDEVLKTLADILKDVTRNCDLIGRLGGEEFAILLPETDVEGASSLADRLLKAVRAERVAIAGGNVGFTISMGLEFFNGHGDLADLLRGADRALYAAKSEGRDRLVIAEGYLSEAAD